MWRKTHTSGLANREEEGKGKGKGRVGRGGVEEEEKPEAEQEMDARMCGMERGPKIVEEIQKGRGGRLGQGTRKKTGSEPNKEPSRCTR